MGMGQSLYQNSESVRELYSRAAEILGWDVAQLSFEGPESTLTETRICQPALYVHGFGVYHYLVRERNLEPDKASSAFGLSLGELTALAVAGVFDFETGLRIVAERGRLMQEACEQTAGGMAALIGGTRESAESLAEICDLDIANYNCPGQIVLSGNREHIRKAVDSATDSGFKMARELNVAGAYHSRLMAPAAEQFQEFLEGIEFLSPRIAVYTNTTGGRIEDPEAIRNALIRQITGSVYFEDNLVRAQADSGCSTFYECGPGSILGGFIRRIHRDWKVVSLSEYADLQNVEWS